MTPETSPLPIADDEYEASQQAGIDRLIMIAEECRQNDTRPLSAADQMTVLPAGWETGRHARPKHPRRTWLTFRLSLRKGA